jgi:hypothetical protein
LCGSSESGMACGIGEEGELVLVIVLVAHGAAALSLWNTLFRPFHDGKVAGVTARLEMVTSRPRPGPWGLAQPGLHADRPSRSSAQPCDARDTGPPAA